jgi:hypothetical protein
MRRISRFFERDKKCAHTRFTEEDIYILKKLLDRKPTLYLSPEPREKIIQHFVESFDAIANTDCLNQALSRKAEIIDELVLVIRDSMIYQFDNDDDDKNIYSDEKELELYLNSVYDWSKVIMKNYTWKECALKIQKFYGYTISHKERNTQGETIDNVFIQYKGIPPSWNELGEIEEYEGEYEYPQHLEQSLEDEYLGYF